jgi:tetratricopeptide (TPR) repeat protein
MINSKNMKIGGLVTVLLIAVAFWGYTEWSNKQKLTVPSDQSLDAGIVLFNQKKYLEALEVFENIPAGAPDEWWARYYQGSTYIMLKDYSSATTYLEQALILSPTQTRIMHALGVAYFKLGNLQMSKAYFVAVLEVDPGDEEAKGLMDIMDKLEQQQSTKDKQVPEPTIENLTDN